ncbi:uncharacterized protein [Arachis hypogaea]|uniref:uncharacterized protein n=1 Tax=Arachis hypogaea TaxID=3818 RepID=UPI000DEC745B|nr:uncharacterized protein LOC112717934 [Arachis hypogaea]
MAENTRLKTLEAELKCLGQCIEEVSDETRAERARATEATSLKGFSHGSNSGHGVDNVNRLAQHSRVKFDLPKFDGSDDLRWIFSMDQYFEFFKVPDDEQIGIAAIHMVGPTILWFQMSQRSAQFHSWTQLKRVIELEFGPSLFESPRELLFKLQQQGTVGEYYAAFVALANRSHIEPPEALKDYFIGGLRANIRREVKAQCPHSLMRALTLARMQEEKFASIPRTTYNTSQPCSVNPSYSSSQQNRSLPKSPLPPLLPIPVPCSAVPPSKNSVRRLSPAKIQNKRDKGLCYWCDEKFSATHRCANKQYLQLHLELDDSIDADLETINDTNVDLPLEALEQEVAAHHLSYNAMHGTRGPAMIRFTPVINGHEVHTLLDGGGAQIALSNPVLSLEGMIPSLDITISDNTISIPEVFVLHVAGGELVIGSNWFMHDGKFITIQGYKSAPSSQAQFHHIRRMLSTDALAEMFTLEVQYSTVPATPLLQLPDSLNPALGLPPQRSQDHAIPLIKGAEPVKARPYRYPHHLKSQIELMVNEMLQEDELLDELFGANIFSKLDLRSGFHQILVNPDDRFKTAFRTHQGLYEWLVMPFGLTNAPATFQSLMNEVFKPYLQKFMLVFFDDILIYSDGFTKHLEHLEVVLKLLQQKSLFAKLSKCIFGSSEVDYLGHTIRGGGVHMEMAKVQAVMDWPQPTNIKQLRGFLGLTRYYRRFIKGYASLAFPLTDLLKKDDFVWSTEASKAFTQLQKAICSKPVLQLPNFDLPFEVETDASGLGIVHQSLKALLKQHKWMHKLLGYDFEIHYKSGAENVAADALLRSFLGAWSAPRADWLRQLKEDLAQNPDLQHEYHDSVIGGHAGIAKTVERICAIFYWPNMQRDIRHYVLNCCVCQQAKVDTKALAGLLKPLPVPSQVWKDIAMDFITALPLAVGNSSWSEIDISFIVSSKVFVLALTIGEFSSNGSLVGVLGIGVTNGPKSAALVCVTRKKSGSD